MTKPTPADLIRAAEIEEALAQHLWMYGPSKDPYGVVQAQCLARAAALRAMAQETQP